MCTYITFSFFDKNGNKIFIPPKYIQIYYIIDNSDILFDYHFPIVRIDVILHI